MPFLESIIPKEAEIVDLGCGHGFFSHYLVETSSKRRVIGIDIDKRKINLAKGTIRDRADILFECKDISKLEGEYDIVMLYDVIHHIPFEEQKNCLKACYEKLRKGGQVSHSQILSVASC